MRTRPTSLFGLAVVGLLLALAAGCGSAPHTTTKTAQPHRSFPELVQAVRSGVVRIETNTCEGKGVGTGFLVSPRLIATVEHVVDGAQRIALKKGKKVVSSGTVIGADAVRDIALVQARHRLDGYIFKLASRTPALGEAVAALGFPLGLPLSVNRGSVSGTKRNIQIEGLKRRGLVQTDAAVNPGNSGGPLLAVDSGQVVGLVDLGTTGANGLAFAVSSRVSGPLLQAWRSAPQPISASSCTTGPGQSLSDSGRPSTGSHPTVSETFDGAYFSIDYPAPWSIKASDERRPWGSDTTIVDPAEPSTELRVDVSRNVHSTDAMSEADKVITAVRGSPGYQELDLSRETFQGYDAVHWEFTIRESGRLMHKEDEVLINEYGDGVAILTQAADSRYPDLADVFAQMRDSYTAK